MRLLIIAVSGGIASATGGLHARLHQPPTVEIKTFQFAPDTLRVKTGTRVVFANRDDIEHTVTAGSPDKRDPSFNRALSGVGARVEVSFDHPGTLAFFCDRHQFMRGAIIVTR